MTIALIGGSGFQRWERFVNQRTVEVETPYASDPVTVQAGTIGDIDVVFIPRHGAGHSVPPHRINYRANIRALRELKVSAVLAIATVGGISRQAAPGALMVPDQILDYTHDRDHTFFDGEDGVVAHADMTEPYCDELREYLLASAGRLDLEVIGKGIYAATQGPRFETPAEIRRMERDGADVVGMTGMPEAALARELQLPYAAVALVANSAAGKDLEGISMDEIRRVLEEARSRVERLLTGVIPDIADVVFDVPPPMRP